MSTRYKFAKCSRIKIGNSSQNTFKWKKGIKIYFTKEKIITITAAKMNIKFILATAWKMRPLMFITVVWLTAVSQYITPSKSPTICVFENDQKVNNKNLQITFVQDKIRVSLIPHTPKNWFWKSIICQKFYKEIFKKQKIKMRRSKNKFSEFIYPCIWLYRKIFCIKLIKALHITNENHMSKKNPNYSP